MGITGFTTQYAFTYENIYIDREKKHSMNIGAYYETQNKLEYITENNKPILFEYDEIIYQKAQLFLQVHLP